MADFNEAYQHTSGIEGGYADDPTDRGGETYRGIARKWYPAWPGWKIVDSFKTLTEQPNPNFLQLLAVDEPLHKLVRDFYKTEYWDSLRCYAIDSQAIATELFDTAVNMSKIWAIKFLQQALNALNQNAKFYNDISVDGAIGPATLRTLVTCLSYNDEILILKIMNGLQLARFIEIMTNDPTQEKFARGWIGNRIQIGKA